MPTGDPLCPYCGCYHFGKCSEGVSHMLDLPTFFAPISFPADWSKCDQKSKEKRADDTRPDWDDVYMAMAFLAARRSLDPRTKHGCVLVSADNRPLSWGCNGPIKGIDDAVVPLTAPDKYYHMLHAEKNALLNYGGSHADFKGSTAYVTGECCIKFHCLPSLIQSGVSRVVQGHVRSVMIHNVDDEEFKREQEAKRIMVEQSGIQIVNVGPKASIRQVLQDALDYFDEKAG